MAQMWTLGVASPRGVRRVAEHVERAGWDGLAVVDSQNLSGDAYVALAMAATVTQRIGLGTGVTNSVTRQAAVRRDPGGRADQSFHALAFARNRFSYSGGSFASARCS